MTDKDTITLPREVVERLVATWDWDAETLIGHRMKIMSELVDNLRTHLAAKQPKPARLHATTTGVLLGSAWLVWNTPVGANDEIMSQETADLLNRIFADAEALRREDV